MKKRGFLLVSLVMLVLFCLAGCATEKKFWSEVTARNTERAYDQYLARYPKGRYISEAQTAKQRIKEKEEFNQTSARKNENVYRDFLEKYPNSQFASEISRQLALLETNVWNEASRGNSIEAIDLYLKRFPGGRHTKEAETKKAQLFEYQAWEKARQADSHESYDQYLGLYPQGKYAADAKAAQQRLIEKREFDQAAAAQNSEEALQGFLKKYPTGTYASEARRKLTEIEKREFDKAAVLNSEDALRDFLKRYPNGSFAREAKNRLTEIEVAVWKKAETENLVEAFDDYLKRFPEGRYARKAQNRKSALLEQQAWEKAKAANSFTSYGEYIKSYPRNPHAEEARKEIAKSYKLNDAEIANVAKLQQDKPAEAKKAEYIDKLIFSGANCLDSNANWIDRVKGRQIYDMLKKYDSQTLTDSMIRVVLIEIDRLKVLFLVVKLGVSGTQKPLNDLLMEYGDKSTAEDYLNCGSKDLYDGGAAWAKAHGGYISTGWGSHRFGWGSF